MLRLRQFKKCDAESIVSWCQDERIFHFWSGDRFGDYPITADTLLQKYLGNNGDCSEADNFYPMTAVDDEGAVGHFIIRYIYGDKNTLRFGWVIVDGSRRGQGCGSEMLRLGLRYAFEIMRAERVTLGVYEDNEAACRCYRAVGFREAQTAEKDGGAYDGKQRIIEMEITREEYERKV